MKKKTIVTTLLAAIFGLASCNSDSEFHGNEPVLIIDPIETGLDEPTATTALSLSNTPITDGSDSTEPLRNLLTYQLFYQLASGQHNDIVKESGYIEYR